MSARELLEWSRYFAEEDDRNAQEWRLWDALHAHLCMMMAGPHRNTTEHPAPFRLEEFLLFSHPEMETGAPHDDGPVEIMTDADEVARHMSELLANLKRGQTSANGHVTREQME